MDWLIKPFGGDLLQSKYPDSVKDLSLRTDSNHNPLILSGPARYKQIVTMLFNMVPGMDEFNPEKGLNIAAKLFVPQTAMQHDTEYENEIVNQFTKYTDLTVTNVTAMGIDGYYCVFFSIVTQEGVYQVLMNTSSNQLNILLINQETSTSADK